MNGVGRSVAVLLKSGSRLWSLACLIGVRHRSMLVALPLCSSLCFFGLRLVLSVLGLAA
ncbi:hypothetical protein [Paraburkholderia dilworthii]|uniref:hypothetical protein n=1 Tax=Paraburkholderia dilworthii TaxID=948106 RepID=UPI000415D0C2|nr:hypothetical protein [Paraburkholderia dilworthii]